MDTAQIEGLKKPQGFIEVYEELLKNNSQMTKIEAYQECERLRIEAFGKSKYKDYRNFLNSKSYHNCKFKPKRKKQ